MTRHDLPVVLRHGNGNDLVGTAKKGKNGGSHSFRSRVELREGQGLSGVRDLQGGEVRELLGGATEDFREPTNALLMRRVCEVVAVKDVRQAVLAGICLVVRRLCRRYVSPPSRNREQQEKPEHGCSHK